MKYRLEDDSRNIIAESDDPSDLFDADEADDEIAAALFSIEQTPEVLIGGGAAPLFILVNVELYGQFNDA